MWPAWRDAYDADVAGAQPTEIGGRRKRHREKGDQIMSHFIAARNAIKVLPVLAAAMAFGVVLPAQSVGAAGFTTTSIVAPISQTIKPSQPDLTVSAAVVTTSYPWNGYTVYISTLTIYVRNIGKATSSPTDVLVQRTGASDLRYAVPSLSNTDWYAYKIDGGEVYGCTAFVVRVDPGNLNSESNEYNNTYSFSWGC